MYLSGYRFQTRSHGPVVTSYYQFWYPTLQSVWPKFRTRRFDTLTRSMYWRNSESRECLNTRYEWPWVIRESLTLMNHKIRRRKEIPSSILQLGRSWYTGISGVQRSVDSFKIRWNFQVTRIPFITEILDVPKIFITKSRDPWPKGNVTQSENKVNICKFKVAQKSLCIISFRSLTNIRP